jgi:predicted Zn-dependent protease
MSYRRLRYLIAGLILAFGLIRYLSLRQENPITGEIQAVALTTDQEIALGLNSAPRMAAEFGGADPDGRAQALLRSLGEKLVQQSVARQSPYRFQFSLLRDPQTVNAFALPGGPIFLTRGLFERLENEAQLAGVLGHEIGHVLARHSAEQMAKSQLAQTIVGAAGVAASDEYGRGRSAAVLTAFVAQMVQMKYGRDDELQSDQLAVRIMADAGYDPRELIAVMDILERASGGSRQPEFASTHPNPGNRREVIRAEIARLFPSGVPAKLTAGRRLR